MEIFETQNSKGCEGSNVWIKEKAEDCEIDLIKKNKSMKKICYFLLRDKSKIAFYNSTLNKTYAEYS